MRGQFEVLLPCRYKAAGRALKSTRGGPPTCRLCSAAPASSCLHGHHTQSSYRRQLSTCMLQPHLSQHGPLAMNASHPSISNNWPTLDHVFASLAAGWPTEDVLLETVSLDWLRQLSLRLWLGFGRHRQRRTDRRWVRRQGEVGTARRGMWGRALIGQGRFGEGGRRWRWWRRSDKGWRKTGFTVTALEKVVHALAAHDWLEGQGALQPLQLKGKTKRRYVRDL